MVKEKSDFRKTPLFEAFIAAKSYFLYAALFSAAVNILMLVPSIYMLQVYDRVVASGSMSTLLMLTLIMMFLLSSMGGLEWVRSRVLVRASARLEQLLKDRVFNATFKQSLYTTSAGTQPLSDLTGLRQFMTGPGLFAFFDAPWVPVYIMVMFLFHPIFGWMAIFGAVVLLCIAFINEKVTKQKLKEANEKAGWVNNFANKNIRNAEVIESMGMLGNVRHMWASQGDEVQGLQTEASNLAGILTSFSKAFRVILQSLILGMGAYLAVKQEITPGLMIAGSLLLGRALAPIDQMVGAWTGFVNARSQYARLNSLLEKIPEQEEKMELPSPVGAISANAIVVAPPGTRTPVLTNINFELAAGETMGVIGPSAAGKSTLARALLGIWPTMNGSVRLDGADIFAWDRELLGPHIGYLPQDIELFDGSISDNISRFSGVDADKVVAAAQLAGVHEMILKLPQGYDTVIGGDGGMLSGGQRQRVGLARALYGNPKFIVLDEPNSNLDEQGDKALSQALDLLKGKGVTIVVIAHRPQILRKVDKILVLANGAMADFGPRDDVMAKYTQKASSAPALLATAALNQ
jgi:ATP-binding cassette subfamily C protein EexD